MIAIAEFSRQRLRFLVSPETTLIEPVCFARLTHARPTDVERQTSHSPVERDEGNRSEGQ